MCETTAPEDEKPQSNGTDGFKFAVTVVATFGTIIYATYTYLQNTPVDNNFYVLVSALISVALILVVSLLIYMLIKGYSIEVQDTNQKERLEKRVSHIYSISFFVFTMLLTFIMYIFILLYLKIENSMHKSIFGVICSYVLCLYILDEIRGKQISPLGGAIGLLMGMLVVLALLSPVLHSPLQGHVIVDMEDVYYKNNVPIPVLIQITGPNTGLLIELLKEESSNLRPIASIDYLEPQHNLKTTSNNSLVGNAMGSGKYNVFVNTTNLTPGYYELICIRPKYEEMYGARGFYLLNSSHISNNLIADTTQ